MYNSVRNCPTCATAVFTIENFSDGYFSIYMSHATTINKNAIKNVNSTNEISHLALQERMITIK